MFNISLRPPPGLLFVVLFLGLCLLLWWVFIQSNVQFLGQNACQFYLYQSKTSKHRQRAAWTAQRVHAGPTKSSRLQLFIHKYESPAQCLRLAVARSFAFGMIIAHESPREHRSGTVNTSRWFRRPFLSDAVQTTAVISLPLEVLRRGGKKTKKQQHQMKSSPSFFFFFEINWRLSELLLCTLGYSVALLFN